MQTRRSLRAFVATLGIALVAVTSVQAQTFNPIPLTPGSFTQEIVVPVDWTYHLNAQSVTVTVDHGPALQTNGSVAGFPPYFSVDSGDAFFEMGLERTSAVTLKYGFPPGGSLLTNTTFTSHVYQLPFWTNYNSNCLCICPYTNGGTYNGFPLTDGPYIGQNYNTNVNLTLNNSTPYTALSFLCSGGGPFTNSVTISYADGTSQGPVPFVIPNWFVNSNVYVPSGGNVYPNCGFAYTAQSRCNPAQNQNSFSANFGVASGSRLWSIDIALANPASAVTNLSFNPLYTNNAAGTAPSEVIFAVSGSSNPSDNAAVPNTNVLTGPFAPISVSGFNAGVVVPNAPLTLAGVAPLTATMDNGTNLGGGANTWFEQGWDKAAPTNGFPPHNTLLTSVSNPARTYQMPASYHQPMCVLIDKNHTLANITPQNAGTFTGLSLLTAGASIGNGKQMTNFIVLQHSDGVSETNVFIGFDWFETTVPPAWSAFERVNIGTSGSSNGVFVSNLENAGGPPHLFDSEFQMSDDSPITNIQVGFVTAPAANSTTYVIAISGTTNFIPVQVSTNTAAQNVYAGGSANFHVGIAFGTIPSFQWQVVNGGVTNNLTDGPTGTGSTIIGSTSSTLTVSNVSSSDEAYYVCLVSNLAPSSALSTPAPLTLLVSTLADVTQPGDSITDFPDVIPSPAGLTLPDVIDGTMATYLNYGGSGSTGGPFIGPVGFIVTPGIGATVVSGLRFVTAVNAVICDPADYMLEGSNDGGNTWTPIVADSPLSLPDTRNPANTGAVNITNNVLQEVDFANSTPYATYRVTINHVKSDSTANSMQIAEVQLLGSLAQLPPGIVVQPVTNKTVFVGANVGMSVVGNGPQPITYQWYFNSTTAITGATNATFVLTNAQLTDAGTYSVTLSNAFGPTVSSNLNLTVLTATNAYVNTVMNDHPIAYWRLDEGPDDGNGDNGVVANDFAGGPNGVYTNVTLRVAGYSAFDSDTAVQFENVVLAPSYVGKITGITFATPTNTSGNFTIEAWANGNKAQVAGAGVVALGYGGGGEEFALDCGATSNNYRFYFRDAGGASHPANSAANSQNSSDSKWHHLVGVVNESASNEIFYVDGLMVASNAVVTNAGVLQPNPLFPLFIGARAQATTNPVPNLQFFGSVDEVAIYNYALTSNQVQTHYFVSGIVPQLTLSPTNVTVPEGSSATFTGAAYGSTPLGLQWWNSDGGNPTTPIAGKTNGSLTLPNVTASQNNTFYQFVATNAYGGVTSSPVVLTVISGPPQINTDISSTIIAYAGSPLSLTVTVRGTPPFSYQWQRNGANLVDGGRFSGSQSNTLTISEMLLTDTGDTYQLFISNAQSAGNPTASTLAAVTVLPVLTLNGFGSGWAANGSATYPSSNLLQLVDGGSPEASSSFFASPIYIASGFKASWTYQDVNGGGADGMAFVLQNDPRGAAALGGGGGSLGVSGISPSAELEFNVYSPNIPGYAFEVNGANPGASHYSPTGLLGIDSGDPISVALLYLNGTATLTLTDAVANTSFTTSANINIPALVGGNSAYVGFTGADGGTASIQQVSNFTFTSFTGLNIQTTNNSLVITWPEAVGGYVLEQTPTLSPPSWTPVATQPTATNGVNEVTVPASSDSSYYRLHNP